MLSGSKRAPSHDRRIVATTCSTWKTIRVFISLRTQTEQHGRLRVGGPISPRLALRRRCPFLQQLLGLFHQFDVRSVAGRVVALARQAEVDRAIDDVLRPLAHLIVNPNHVFAEVLMPRAFSAPITWKIIKGKAEYRWGIQSNGSPRASCSA